MLKPESGFTLVELSVAMGIIAILIAASSVGLSIYTKNQKAIQASYDLREVLVAQKQYITKHLSDNVSLNLAGLSLSTLRTEGFLPAANLPSEAWGTIDCTVMPPTHSLDGTQGDIPKISRTTGDYLYDIGPE